MLSPDKGNAVVSNRAPRAVSSAGRRSRAEANVLRHGPLGHGTDVIRGAVDLLVLSVISITPATAAAVSERIETLSGCQLSPADHIVYHSLERMRGWGWIDLATPADTTDPVDRYRITRTGRRNFTAAQKAWLRLSSAATAIIAASRQPGLCRRQRTQRLE